MEKLKLKLNEQQNAVLEESPLRTELFFEVKPGLKLFAEAWGMPEDRPVILAHGGGQTCYAWVGTAEYLAKQGWYAIAVDQRGHGNSDWAADGDYQMETFADDLRFIANQCRQRPVIVGASLGGISAMLAQDRANHSLFAALVLVDVTPRMEKAGIDKIMGFMTAHSEEGFANLEEAAAAIANYLPHRKRAKNLNGLKKNLRLRPDGRYRWHWDPRFLEGKTNVTDKENQAQQKKLEGATENLSIPTLLVRGKSSDVVSEEAVFKFLEQVPHAKFADVADAGHMVAGDRNDIFQNAVIDFLDGLPKEAGGQ